MVTRDNDWKTESKSEGELWRLVLRTYRAQNSVSCSTRDNEVQWSCSCSEASEMHWHHSNPDRTCNNMMWQPLLVSTCECAQAVLRGALFAVCLCYCCPIVTYAWKPKIGCERRLRAESEANDARLR